MFMSHRDTLCWHELANSVSTKEEYQEQMNKSEYTGDSTTLGSRVTKDYPEAKLVLIHRDVRDSYDATRALGLLMPDISLWYKEAKWLLEQDGLHIHYDEINNNLQEIWEHCTDLPYDISRERKILDMNITTNNFTSSTYLHKLFEESA